MLPKDVLEELFDSKKVKIIRFFVNNTDDKFYLREVARNVKVPPATTFRIINSLVEMEILEVIKIKRTKLYSLADNKNTEGLKDIFEEKKSAVQEFIEFCSQIENVERIILHGKETKDKTNLLIIGSKIDSVQIKQKVGEIKEKYKISIIELTLAPDQFQQMSVMGLFPGKKTQLWPK